MQLEFVSNTLFLLITIFIFLRIFFTSGEYRAPIAYISFWLIWALISTYANDLGDYNFELRMHTHSSFATTILSIFYIAFYTGIYFFLRIESNLNSYTVNFSPYRLNLSKGFFFIFIIIFGLIVFVEMILAISSYEVGVSRAESFETASLFVKFLLEYNFFAPVLMAIFRHVHNGYFKKLSNFLVFFYVVLLIALGNKFSTILEFFFYFLVPTYWLSGSLPIKIRFMEILRNIFSIKYLSLACLFLILIFSSYSQIATNNQITTNSSQLLFELLYDRIFLFQGQLFWVSYQDYMSLNFVPGEQLFNEISRITSQGSIPNHKLGLQFVMVQAIGDSAYPIIQKGYLYTNGFPGILLYMFDVNFILVIMMILGFIICAMFYVWKLSVKKKSLMLQLITLSLLAPLITVLGTGNLYVFFTLLSIFKILIMFMMLVIGYRR